MLVFESLWYTKQCAEDLIYIYSFILTKPYVLGTFLSCLKEDVLRLQEAKKICSSSPSWQDEVFVLTESTDSFLSSLNPTCTPGNRHLPSWNASTKLPLELLCRSNSVLVGQHFNWVNSQLFYLALDPLQHTARSQGIWWLHSFSIIHFINSINILFFFLLKWNMLGYFASWSTAILKE